MLDIYNEEDFKIYNQFIFKENIDFLKNTPKTKHNNYLFSYNFRVKNTKGNFIPIFQQGYYFTSPETNLPLLSIGSVIDISTFKRDSLIYHNIQEIKIENNSIVKLDIKQNCYNPDIEKVNLSSQELNILKYIADGLSIKQIADKLKISTNTVANHRKNMFKKTNTKNMAELVRLGCDMKFIN